MDESAPGRTRERIQQGPVPVRSMSGSLCIRAPEHPHVSPLLSRRAEDLPGRDGDGGRSLDRESERRLAVIGACCGQRPDPGASDRVSLRTTDTSMLSFVW